MSEEARAEEGAAILVEVSAGELLDKISVLRIKAERIEDPAKLRNVRAELRTLETARDQAIEPFEELDRLAADLKAVNAELWDVIATIYACEKDRAEESKFVALARSVYRLNDQRAALKRRINHLCRSRLLEEKAHELPNCI